MDIEKLITLYRDYLKVEHNAHTTIVRKISQLQSFLRSVLFMGIGLDEVSAEHITEYLEEKSSLYSVRMQNRQVIAEFLDILIHREELLENPARDISITGDTPEKEYPIPSFEEIESITKRILKENSLRALRDFCMIELAYGSGARRCEIVRANIEDFDSQKMVIILRGKGRGESKKRVVPVTPAFSQAVRKYLSKRRALAGALFVAETGKRISAGTVNQRFLKWTSHNPHLFRHAFATHLYAAGTGANVHTIAQMLGHTRPSTTSIYAHLTFTDLQKNLHKNHPRNSFKNPQKIIP